MRWNPMSFLINHCYGSLNDMLKTVQDNNKIMTFKANLRADSTMRFLICSMRFICLPWGWHSQLLVLRVIFILFVATYGLHINRYKRFIYPVNEVNEIQALVGILVVKSENNLQFIWGCHWGQEQVKGDLKWGHRKMWKKANQLEESVFISVVVAGGGY